MERIDASDVYLTSLIFKGGLLVDAGGIPLAM
jgi:hypothetical protein